MLQRVNYKKYVTNLRNKFFSEKNIFQFTAIFDAFSDKLANIRHAWGCAN